MLSHVMLSYVMYIDKQWRIRVNETQWQLLIFNNTFSSFLLQEQSKSI